MQAPPYYEFTHFLDTPEMENEMGEMCCHKQPPVMLQPYYYAHEQTGAAPAPAPPP